MSNFPTRFANKTEPLKSTDFNNDADRSLLKHMRAKGYEVHVGLTEMFANEIIKMAQEPAIKEYCPNDHGSRFADMESVQKWLQKGRAIFLLIRRDNEDLSLVGYGWAGNSTSDKVPGGQVTFAIRIGEAGQGRGLATSYARLIVVASASLFGARDFWLETWASNAAAVHIYHKIGFEDVWQQPGERPTQEGGTVSDTRLYMLLQNNLIRAI
jgi:ribosomal protein S18 acetylase RimI-like enzyme